jgi:hypothetical protein
MPAGAAAVDCAGEAFVSAVIADAVFDPQQTAADGRDRLQYVVPLVCGLNLDEELCCHGAAQREFTTCK